MIDPHESDPAEDPERHIGVPVEDPWATEPAPDVTWRNRTLADVQAEASWPGF